MLLAVLMLVTYVPFVGMGLVDFFYRLSATTADAVLVERDGAIATVVLDRPDKLNALTLAMWRELGERMRRALRRRRRCAASSCAAPARRRSRPATTSASSRTERSNKAQAVEYGAVMHATADALARCRHPLVAQIHGSL